MKKFIKTLSLAVAFLICISLSLPAMVKVAVYAGTSEGYATVLNYLSVPGFVPTGSIGTVYEIAPATKAGAPTEIITVAVKDSQGNAVTVTDNKFTPLKADRYSVIYTYDNHATTMYVDVSGVARNVTVSFASNPTSYENIVPSIINPNDNGEDLTLQFPDAIVKDANGNIVDISEILGATITTAMSSNIGTSETADWNSETKILTLDKTKDNITYKVKYEYKISGTLIAYNSIEVYADTDYENDYDYTIAYSSTKPTTAEIGVETILPAVTATNTTTSAQVNVYYSVQITQGTTTYTATDTGNDVLTINENGQYVFTPAQEGDYVVTYAVKNLNNKAPSNSTTSFNIDDVTDNTAPAPIVSLPYTVNANGYSADASQASEALASVWTNADIMILPIYATDSANAFVANNLTLKRKILDSSSNVKFDESTYSTASIANKVLIFNASAETIAAANDAVLRTVYLNGVPQNILKSDCVIIENTETETYTLAEGTYTVKYIAKDKLSGKGEITSNQTVKIDTGFNPETSTNTPTVKFATSTTIPSYMNLGASTTFAKPTASEVSGDTRLTTFITYQTSTDNGLTYNTEVRFNAENSWITYDESTSKYTLTIPNDEDSITNIKIIANSTNDIGNNGTISKVIKVINSGDSVATTITAEETTIAENDYKQGNDTILPTVTYSDDLVNYVNVKITIVDENDKTYSAQDVEYLRNSDAGTVIVGNAHFVPEIAGDYTVTYISTDAGNNKTIIIFTLIINENPASWSANFENLPSSINGGIAEVGEQISINPVEVFVSTDSLIAQDWYFNVKGNADYDTDNQTFITFNTYGDYTIQFVCRINYAEDYGTFLAGDKWNDIQSKEYTMVVSDTKGPEILNAMDMENDFYELTKDGSLTISTTATPVSYALPLPQASDIVWGTSFVTVASSSTTTTYYLNSDGITSLSAIKFTRNDTYTITYNLKDSNNNTTTKSFSVDVGDVFAPEIEVEDSIVSSTYAIDDTLIIDMSKITAEDIIDGDVIYKEGDVYKIKDNCTISVKIKNTTTSTTYSSNTDVPYDADNLKFEFDLTVAGQYQLIVEITDTSSKTATYNNLTFTVTDDANTGATAEEVLGIVLIIISVLLLGGVITYFVVSRKNLEKKYK